EIVAEDQPYAEDASRIAQSPEYEQWAYLSTHPSKRLTYFCYDDDDDDDDEDYTFAITPNEPVLSTEEPDNSLTLNDNPTPSSDCKTKSPSTSLNSLLEETNTFDNSLPEFETFCFDVEKISNGSTTTSPDISLPKYKVFYDDHVKKISSGSPTTHSDSSLYASFIVDLLINPFPPVDRSDFYEFTDDLIPFISPPEYDCFLFK
nr:hypothetical protein [Tanacetum cinerariifolium]